MIEKLVEFVIFFVLQSIAINGVYESFQPGQIFYLIAPGFIERNKNKKWSKPFFSCVRCMASVWGGIFFWGTIIPIFGFHPFEIWVFIFDVFLLVYLNPWFYKKA